jgi:hypothetical protein
MSDYDIHSCGYYCDRHACIVAQRNELRDKLFSDQAVKPDGVALTSIEHPHLGKPSKHKISKKSLETMVLETEWQGLTSEELEFYTEELGQGELGRGVLRAVDDFLREKNSD